MTQTLTAREQIDAALHNYGQGTHYGDGAALKEAFHPQATISGYYEGHLGLSTRDEFIHSIEGMPVPATQGQPYEKETTFVEISGTVAIARMREIYQGLIFTDYFTFIEIDGRWAIIHKAFTHEPLTHEPRA